MPDHAFSSLIEARAFTLGEARGLKEGLKLLHKDGGLFETARNNAALMSVLSIIAGRAKGLVQAAGRMHCHCSASSQRKLCSCPNPLVSIPVEDAPIPRVSSPSAKSDSSSSSGSSSSSASSRDSSSTARRQDTHDSIISNFSDDPPPGPNGFRQFEPGGAFTYGPDHRLVPVHGARRTPYEFNANVGQVDGGLANAVGTRMACTPGSDQIILGPERRIIPELYTTATRGNRGSPPPPGIDIPSSLSDPAISPTDNMRFGSSFLGGIAISAINGLGLDYDNISADAVHSIPGRYPSVSTSASFAVSEPVPPTPPPVAPLIPDSTGSPVVHRSVPSTPSTAVFAPRRDSVSTPTPVRHAPLRPTTMDTRSAHESVASSRLSSSEMPTADTAPTDPLTPRMAPSAGRPMPAPVASMITTSTGPDMPGFSTIAKGGVVGLALAQGIAAMEKIMSADQPIPAEEAQPPLHDYANYQPPGAPGSYVHPGYGNHPDSGSSAIDPARETANYSPPPVSRPPIDAPTLSNSPLATMINPFSIALNRPLPPSRPSSVGTVDDEPIEEVVQRLTYGEQQYLSSLFSGGEAATAVPPVLTNQVVDGVMVKAAGAVQATTLHVSEHSERVNVEGGLKTEMEKRKKGKGKKIMGNTKKKGKSKEKGREKADEKTDLEKGPAAGEAEKGVAAGVTAVGAEVARPTSTSLLQHTYPPAWMGGNGDPNPNFRAPSPHGSPTMAPDHAASGASNAARLQHLPPPSLTGTHPPPPTRTDADVQPPFFSQPPFSYQSGIGTHPPPLSRCTTGGPSPPHTSPTLVPRSMSTPPRPTVLPTPPPSTRIHYSGCNCHAHGSQGHPSPAASVDSQATLNILFGYANAHACTSGTQVCSCTF